MINLQKQTLGSENVYYILYQYYIIFKRKWNGSDFSVDNFIEEGERFLDTEGNKLPDGEHPTIHWNRFNFSVFWFTKLLQNIRFLQQWCVAWNDYAGNIWITTAESLPNFKPPRILIPKRTEDQKNWYPNFLHKTLGKCIINT